MAHYMHNDVLDAALNYIADNGNKLALCSGLPATYSELSGSLMLAITNMVTGAGGVGSSYGACGDQSGGGRSMTPVAQSAVTVSVSGTGTHLAIGDSANSKVLHVEDIADVAVTTGRTTNLTCGKIIIADPITTV